MPLACGDAGREPVHRRSRRDDVLDNSAAGVHPRGDVRVEVDRLLAPGNADDLAERQGASGDRDGHCARASLTG